MVTTEQTSTHEAEVDHSSRSTAPSGDAFLRYIGSGWGEHPTELPQERRAAAPARARRERLGRRCIGDRIVIRAGQMKQRSNDTFYPFRAHSAFAHLTSWGSDAEPGSILVLDPIATGSHDAEGAPTHRATLYFREAAGKESDEFFANPEIGEFWVGRRPSLEEVAADLAIETAPLEAFVAHDDDRTLEDPELARLVSEMRLVKDEFEIAELQAAVDATATGFDEVLQSLGRAREVRRGERLIEGVFNTRARLDGNTVGYETIAAAGAHACTLHWIRNDGPVREGDLLLLDAGIELDSLYTADITRTVPVSGTFSPVQRRVYEAVLEAADAARAIIRPGIRFGDVHDAAMAVIARRTREWGLPLPLPSDSSDESASGDDVSALPTHRRYMVHGTSHHLGLDVHDCAQARRELYLDGIIEAGMVFTVEPGLYFQPDDLTVPAELRGIGVRIEDDVVVTDTGCVNLSADIPRTADEVEAWVQRQLSSSQ